MTDSETIRYHQHMAAKFSRDAGVNQEYCRRFAVKRDWEYVGHTYRWAHDSYDYAEQDALAVRQLVKT